MATVRLRRSLQSLQNDYNNGNRAELENLIKAFRGIQALEPHNPNSFFCIAGYHGEPFEGPGVTDPAWWGGYCNHGNVLFPTWHRVYLLRLENALRSIKGCEDVTLPYWDELFDAETPIPEILTSLTFPGDDGRPEPNPLYSYTLQEALFHNVSDANNRYTKHRGYTTVRYPLSGLVGTAQDSEVTDAHNKGYLDVSENIQILNKNVANWLDGRVKIDDQGDGARVPDTYSVRARFSLCLQAPNYTVFSNIRSQNQWIKDMNSEDKHHVVSLESPHNAIHLAVGGFYQKGVYNADPIIGANGDMGENETASFDPIFFLHHCFIDYVFWKWQEIHGKIRPDSLDVREHYPGTFVPEKEGLPFLPPGTNLTIDTPLYPFRKPDQTYYTSREVTNIVTQLKYNYELGSLDIQPKIDLPEIEKQIISFKRAHGINRADYPGSFVIRTFIGTKDNDKIEIGNEPVLSRRDVAGCSNCQDKLDVESLVPIYKGMIDAFKDRNQEDVKYWAEIQTHTRWSESVQRGAQGPVVDDL